jgi:hypothetical protein
VFETVVRRLACLPSRRASNRWASAVTVGSMRSLLQPTFRYQSWFLRLLRVPERHLHAHAPRGKRLGHQRKSISFRYSIRMLLSCVLWSREIHLSPRRKLCRLKYAMRPFKCSPKGFGAIQVRLDDFVGEFAMLGRIASQSAYHGLITRWTP